MLKKKSGYIGLIGKPNVGKSTLLNALLEKKLSITSRKPQTTHERIIGIKTKDSVQFVYWDSPGIHKSSALLNRQMNRAAHAILYESDLLIFLVNGIKWDQADQWILDKLKAISCPVILGINKLDRIQKKEELYAFIQTLNTRYIFADIIPFSAKTKKNLIYLENKIAELLPFGDHAFKLQDVTPHDSQFLVKEIIREKIIRLTGKELPYITQINVEPFNMQKKIIAISAVIYVKKWGQKAILIGEKGERLKKIGQQARLDIEKFLNRKVFLQLWIKIKKV